MLSSLLSTLAGSAAKVVVATSVTAATVGGAYVSDDVDLPLFNDESSAQEVDEAPDELAFEEAATSDEENTEEEAAGAEVEGDESVEDSSDDEEGDSDKPANHGSKVSAFVHETELEGCEKGQAVAAFASGKERKADKECPTKDGDAEEADDDEAADDGEENSQLHDADENDADESDDDDADADDDDDDADEQKSEKGNQGKGNSSSNGKRGDK